MDFIPLIEALGAGGDIKTGPFGTVLKANQYSTHGVPMLSVGEIRHGSIVIQSDTPRLSVEVTDRLPEYLLRKGDVVFARKGGVERNAYVDSTEEGWFLGSDGLRARPGTGLDGRFLAFQLRTARAQAWLTVHATGSTMPSLSQGILEKLPVWRPPLPEQQAIAEVLGALDDKIAANTALFDSSGKLTAALFTQEMADLPVGRLADVAAINADTRKPGHGTLRYLDIAAVSDGNYISPSTSSWDHAPSRARRGVHHGDTVWSTVRPNRRSHCLVLEDDGSLIASTGLATISPRTDGFSFVFEATRLPVFTDYLVANAEGSAYPAINASKLADAPIPDASLEQIEVFNLYCDPIWESAHAALAESQTLASLRDTLLPALMNGTLRVRGAVKEAEGVL